MQAVKSHESALQIGLDLKVPPAGFEPATTDLENRDSNPLSYGGYLSGKGRSFFNYYPESFHG